MCKYSPCHSNLANRKTWYADSHTCILLIRICLQNILSCVFHDICKLRKSVFYARYAHEKNIFFEEITYEALKCPHDKFILKAERCFLWCQLFRCEKSLVIQLKNEAIVTKLQSQMTRLISWWAFWNHNAAILTNLIRYLISFK